MQISKYSSVGRRDNNEDTYNIITPSNDNDYYFIGLYDGHGGDFVSKYLRDNLKLPQNVDIKSIQESIVNIQNDLSRDHPDKIQSCGSTILGCVINYPELYTINLGDSRIILDRNNQAIQLTRDHKPADKYEMKRIKEMNGGNSLIKYDESDDEYRVGPLSVSRGIGDLDTKPFLSHNPAIAKYKLTNDDKHILMGCDGIWDVIENQEAVDLINNLDENLNKAKELSRLAYNKRSYDNLTSIIINL